MNSNRSEYQAEYYKQNKEKRIAQNKAWYEKNKEQINARKRKNYQVNREEKLVKNREWRKNNPEYDKQWREKNREQVRNSKLKYNYGENAPEIVKILLKEQNGVCALCGLSETRTRNGKVLPLHVDHDHITGKIRGLLCSNCNRGLGFLKDDIKIFLKIPGYLEKGKQ